jgi:4-carboxymuconolactone decarboxylase
MAISDTARKNHDELFPGRVSTLAVTDPELIEYFDNFAFDEVLQHSDLDLPLPGQATTTPETRAEHGLAVQKQIVGADAVDALYANAPDDEQHVQRLLSANCFGDHYTRGGLDLKTRELLTLAMLISLGGADPQVKGHVRGNLNVGNDRATMLAVITGLLPFVGYPRTLNALRALDEITL